VGSIQTASYVEIRAGRCWSRSEWEMNFQFSCSELRIPCSPVKKNSKRTSWAAGFGGRSSRGRRFLDHCRPFRRGRMVVQHPQPFQEASKMPLALIMLCLGAAQGESESRLVGRQNIGCCIGCVVECSVSSHPVSKRTPIHLHMPAKPRTLCCDSGV
jgi:hypothetical protein